MAAFDKIGIGAVLSFDGNKFVAGMKNPRDELGRFIRKGNETVTILTRIKMVGTGAFRALGQSVSMARAGMGRLKSGVMQAGLAFTPMTLAIGAGAKKMADFQQQMQDVLAVSNYTTDQFAKVEAKSKQLGATTKFTATQAGEGFELLSRAGFEFADQMGAIEGVLSLAAADSIELSTAAGITSNVLRAMGLEASEAARVSDVLAQTSANANTDVTLLGEAFKFAAPMAATMGIELEDTAVALGLISNAGLRGTLAGNTFKNMLVKLARPTAKAREYMKDYNIQVYETAQGNLDLRRTIESVIEGTKGITSKVKRAGIIAEMFGLRGQGAITAMATAIEKGDFDKLAAAMDNAEGAAKRMADIRMQSLIGQITLMKSALEGAAIEFFEPFVKMAEEGLNKKVIPFLQDVVAVMQELKKPTANVEMLRRKFGFAAEVALGLKDAVDAIRAAITWLTAKVKEWGKWADAKFGKETLRKATKWIAIFTMIAAAVAPIIFGIIMVGMAVSAVTSILSGLAAILTGAFLPVLGIAIVVIGAFQALRRENETFGQTAIRIWGAIKNWALDLWVNVLKPIWEGIREAAQVVLPELKRVWVESFGIVKEALKDLFRTLGFEIGEGKQGWKDMAKTAVFVIAAVIEAVIKLTMYIVVMVVQAVKLFKWFALTVTDFLIGPFIEVWNLLSDVYEAFGMVFSGDIIGGLKHFGKALLNFILAPLRLIIRHIVRLADAIPGLGETIPQGLRDFVNVGTVGLTEVGPAAPETIGKRGVPPFLKKRDKITGETVAKESAKGDLGKMLGHFKNVKDSVMAGTKEGAQELKDKFNELIGATKEQPCVDTNVSVAIDNETVARGQARHKAELGQRAGFKATAWQYRNALEHGAAPVRGRA